MSTPLELCVCGHSLAQHPHLTCLGRSCGCTHYQRSNLRNAILPPPTTSSNILRFRDYGRVFCSICREPGLVRRGHLSGSPPTITVPSIPRDWNVLQAPGGRPQLVCSQECAYRLMVGAAPTGPTPPRRGA